jgi:hypothetical protein
MAKGAMKLVDPYTGKMECRVCGAVHWANLRGGGLYVRGSWQCSERDSHPAEAPLEALDNG